MASIGSEEAPLLPTVDRYPTLSSSNNRDGQSSSVLESNFERRSTNRSRCSSGLRDSVRIADINADDDSEDDEIAAMEQALRDSPAPKKTNVFMSFVFRPFVMVLTVIVYTTVVLAVGWANKIPSIQMDFNVPDTEMDFFNPHTLKLRSKCGSDVRSAGGLDFRYLPDDEHACWDQYDTSKKWVAAETRRWAGWIHPGPMMSDIGLVVRVRGDIDVILKVNLPDGALETSLVGKSGETLDSSEVSSALDNVNLDQGKARFEIDVTFRTSDFSEDDQISLLYYAPGPFAKSKEDNAKDAVLIPFSTYVEPKQLTDVAAQIPRKDADEKDIRVRQKSTNDSHFSNVFIH